jgi:4-alpha-glucanotransferase
MRSSGILLHITSLPSPHGIGTLGKSAMDFVDFLSEAGQSYWQILPIGPTNESSSPYQSYSTFAGNPLLIDLDELVSEGLLKASEVDEIDWGSDPTRVDFKKVRAGRSHLLRSVYRRGYAGQLKAVQKFREDNADWLEDYAFFMALRKHFGTWWGCWPDELRLSFARAGADELGAPYREKLAEDIEYVVFVQYLFFQQWVQLRSYAQRRDVKLFGDIPIYVPLDSADVWSNPSQFQLDEKLMPQAIAGVPPDGFTADGQLWGNPLYKWDQMGMDGYSWWLHRMRRASELFDVVRIDHFRGLASYWSVPAGDTTARRGHWEQGPRAALIDAIKGECPSMSFVAEDLGYPADDVEELLAHSGFPGMEVLEFSFDTRDGGGNMPYQYPINSVCYIGTHDNETARQWLGSAYPKDVNLAKRYLGLSAEEGYVEGLIRGAMASDSKLFVAQMQDWLGLGAEARMNTPGTVGGTNWCWRLFPGALTPDLSRKIATMTSLFGRSARVGGC